MKLLTKTAGAEVCELFIVNIEKVTPNYYIGRGKIEEIAKVLRDKALDTAIFNNNLAPAQQRNIEDIFEKKVIDRTQLILDIFSQRARTSEGKIQVELAQLNYLLPRLTGKGIMLSRLGGGIGTRGPGETKLEMDRRRIRERIGRLNHEIEDVSRRRDIERKLRKESQIPRIAVAGYTNAGKSTLVNALSGSDIFVEDKLFSTLDPTTRKVLVSGQNQFLLTDTVGFIRDLPSNLIAAFRATLEEIVEADAIVHLVDISHPRAREMEAITRGFLAELGAGDKNTLLALNKIDKLTAEERRSALTEFTDALAISARTGEGLKELCLRLSRLVGDKKQYVKVSIPQAEGRLLWELHEQGEIIKKTCENGNVLIEAKVERALAQRLKPYIAQ